MVGRARASVGLCRSGTDTGTIGAPLWGAPSQPEVLGDTANVLDKSGCKSSLSPVREAEEPGADQYNPCR